MKRFLCLASAICMLAACTAAPRALAEGVVSPDGYFEVTMAAADYMDSWAEAASVFALADGEDAPVNSHLFYLHVFVLDDFLALSYDALSSQLFNWHLEDPAGNMYWLNFFTAEETYGQYRDAHAVFRCFEEPSRPAEYAPEDMKLYASSDVPLSLAGVPQDKPLPRAVVTPEPTAAPAYADRLLRLRDGVRKGTLMKKTLGSVPGSPEWPEVWGKVAFAVFESYAEDYDPILSWTNPSYFDSVPGEYLADSLDEADCLVVIWAVYTHVGYYGRIGNSAYRTETNLTVVDLASEEMYATVRVGTEEPPKTVYTDGNHYGDFLAEDALRMAAEKIAGASREN